MPLPDNDIEYLTERGIAFEVAHEGNMTCVVLESYALPEGFVPATADLLLRLHAGYPDVPPDMWWFDPAVKLADGRQIPAADVQQACLGRTWQRWSRHFNSGQWHSGVDGLESYLALIRSDLDRLAGVPAR